MIGAAVTKQTAGFPQIDMPYDVDQQVAGASMPLDAYPTPAFRPLVIREGGDRLLKGTLLGALLSLPFWFAVCLIVWVLR